MDFGSINAKGPLAQELARVLGTTTQALDRLDGKRDDKVVVTKIQEKFSNRVAALPLSGRGCCNVPAIMFVNNDNAVIDGEDVILVQQGSNDYLESRSKGRIVVQLGAFSDEYTSWGGPLSHLLSGYEKPDGTWTREGHEVIEKYRELLPQMSRLGITRFAQLNKETTGDLLERVHPGRNCSCGSHY